jgi:WD40 repeat protein
MTKSSKSLVELVYDTHRFIMYHQTVIERYPPQVYLSARMFSPRGSRIRNIWRHHTPGSIFKIMPVMDKDWSRCLKTFECQIEPCSIDWSLNSTRLTIGSRDGTIQVWDADSGSCLQTTRIETRARSKPAYSLGSTRVASENYRGWIDIWDVKTGKCIKTIEKSEEYIAELAISQDSEKLVTVVFDGTIRVWDSETGACLRMISYPRLGRPKVTISNDSTWLATWAMAGTTQVWNIRTGECVQNFRGSVSETRVASFSHDSTMIATGFFDGPIRIWDIPTGVCLKTLEGHIGGIVSVVFSHDSTRLASGSENCAIKIWDVRSGACLLTLREHSFRIHRIAFSQDSTKLASGSGDGTIKIWDISAEHSECSESESHDRAVSSVAISPNSKWLASLAEDNTVKIWDLTDGACIRTLKIGEHNSRIGWTTEVVFSPDSTRFALVSNCTPYIWDVESGKLIHTMKTAEPRDARSVAFSHDSSRLASVGQDAVIWDVQTGTCLRVLEVKNSFVHCVAFSHDSTWIALGHSSILVEIRDTNSGDLIRRFTASSAISEVDYIAFSDDSTWIACTLSCSEVEFWEARSGIHHKRFTLDMIPHKYCFGLTEPRDAEEKVYEYTGLAVSSDKAWITYKGKREIAIPSSYQGTCFALSANGKTVGIGCRSGKVWMITVNPISPSIDNLSLEKLNQTGL